MAEENERLIETVDEDGNVVRFELVDIVLVDEDEYGIMLPVDVETHDEDEAIIMKLKKVDDDFIFEYIEDDDEFQRVVDAIEELDDEEYEGEENE